MEETQREDYMLVLSARNLTVGLFFVVAITGTFAGLAYVAGRVMSPAAVAAGVPAPQEQILVIDGRPGESARPAAAPERPRAMRAEPSPAPAPPSAPARPMGPAVIEPQPGQLYLQVAAADRGVAEVFVEFLRRKNLPAGYTMGPDERSYRVLVGPVGDNGEFARLKADLEAAGFAPFPRRIRPAETD